MSGAVCRLDEVPRFKNAFSAEVVGGFGNFCKVVLSTLLLERNLWSSIDRNSLELAEQTTKKRENKHVSALHIARRFVCRCPWLHMRFLCDLRVFVRVCAVFKSCCARGSNLPGRGDPVMSRGA